MVDTTTRSWVMLVDMTTKAEEKIALVTGANKGRGPRTPEQGAAVVIRLAQLDSDGPTGLLFEDETQLMW